MGNYTGAIQSFEEGLEYARSIGYARMEAYILTGIADIYLEIQADEQASQAYDMAEVIAESVQEHFLQVYIKIQKAALVAYKNDIKGGILHLDYAKELVGNNGSVMEQYLIKLEHASLQILDKKTHEVISNLEDILPFFESEGHKVQVEKTHLLLVLAYLSLNQNEKVIEHLLHVFSTMDNFYTPTSLIAISARFLQYFRIIKPFLMQKEYEQFILRVETFQKSLPTLRRKLRELSTIIPLTPSIINIRSLGRMQVKKNNQIITSSDWQTQAARDLFFMLLAHPEGMTKEEISLIFWPDASIDEAKYRFKNTIYRLRRAIGKNCVLLEQNLYLFNNKIDYEYDVELFMRENASAHKAHDPIEKLTHFREALKYYSGAYLSEIDQIWVHSPREYLSQLYLNILLQVSILYFNQSNYDLALDYCQRALEEDSLFEDAHRHAMRIFAAKGNRAAVVKQYQSCVATFEREINAHPSIQTHELFKLLSK